MTPDQIKNYIKVPLDDPRFFTRAYGVAVHRRRQLEDGKDPIAAVCADELNEITKQLDMTNLQESSSYRNCTRSRRLAKLLIESKGRLDRKALDRAVKATEDHLYFLGPRRQDDVKQQEHLLDVLKKIRDNKELASALETIPKPHQHPYADQLIKETLNLSAHETITVAHARQAVLAAWLCYLRQGIGSCFATAPAIIIHQEQPESFLRDLRDLFTVGALTRTVAGVEYLAPLSKSWGHGDLKRRFVIGSDPSANAKELFSSPGLIIALEAVELIDKEQKMRDRAMQLYQLLVELFSDWKHEHAYFITTSEEILERLLMRQYGVTEEEVGEYRHRPPSLAHSGILVDVPAAGGGFGAKGAKCARYLAALDAAKSAYKRVTDNALLRSWEFTIASFAETKAEFTKWNLYSSLGLHPNEEGGIGKRLYEVILGKLENYNREAQQYHDEMEIVHGQITLMESRLNNATSESQARWLQADYRTKIHEMHRVKEMRDEAYLKSKRFAKLYDALIEQYLLLFPRYFQEIYDAGMIDVQESQYDNSPAGFRLIYKHGRTHTAQWTTIDDSNDFIQALTNFFTATEREIQDQKYFKGLHQDIAEITSDMINHIRMPQFLETALERMARAHGHVLPSQPLENMDKIEAKPWVYTSGGNVDTLLSCYFRLEQDATFVERWAESPMELLVFICDTLKQIPYKEMEGFIEDPRRSMLMRSPTHVFLLKPGITPFREGWQHEGNTYTWVRDHWVVPMERALIDLMLNEDMIAFLVEKLAARVPENYQFHFRKTFESLRGSMRPADFRSYMIDEMLRDPGLRHGRRPVLDPGEIDSLLYLHLPLFPGYQLKDRIRELLEHLDGVTEEEVNRAIEIVAEFLPRVTADTVFGSYALLNICKSLLCLVKGQTSFGIDYHRELVRVGRDKGFLLPKPIIFADTNWTSESFSFLINPGTGKLDFWKTNFYGMHGEPMVVWQSALDGSNPDEKWGIYTRVIEYRS
ncbi:MAG: hypothetical protein KDK72_08875 [Chlamydiia bacterium]|nr:hypothetical protein [Chlamydiia bacterium]